MWATPEAAADGGAEQMHCYDCFYERYGDMLTLSELKRSDLHNPAHRADRDAQVARLERAGIGEDDDHSLIEVTVPVDADGVIDITPAVDAARLRYATPDDIA